MDRMVKIVTIMDAIQFMTLENKIQNLMSETIVSVVWLGVFTEVGIVLRRATEVAG